MKEENRSRFRGVYRCGKRWKAQLQSHGVQFYLGMFNTEEEAAKAYDRKARDEKGGKSLTNFDDSGGETGVCQLRPTSSFHYYNDGEEEYIPGDDIEEEECYYNQNRNAAFLGQDLKYRRQVDFNSTTQNMRILWERQNQIAQRLILAKALQSKLTDLQLLSPDQEKSDLLKSLNEEIVMLSVVKDHLEEAVSRCFIMGLECNKNESGIIIDSAYGNKPLLPSNLSLHSKTIDSTAAAKATSGMDTLYYPDKNVNCVPFEPTLTSSHSGVSDYYNYVNSMMDGCFNSVKFGAGSINSSNGCHDYNNISFKSNVAPLFENSTACNSNVIGTTTKNDKILVNDNNYVGFRAPMPFPIHSSSNNSSSSSVIAQPTTTIPTKSHQQAIELNNSNIGGSDGVLYNSNPLLLPRTPSSSSVTGSSALSPSPLWLSSSSISNGLVASDSRSNNQQQQQQQQPLQQCDRMLNSHQINNHNYISSSISNNFNNTHNFTTGGNKDHFLPSMPLAATVHSSYTNAVSSSSSLPLLPSYVPSIQTTLMQKQRNMNSCNEDNKSSVNAMFVGSNTAFNSSKTHLNDVANINNVNTFSVKNPVSNGSTMLPSFTSKTLGAAYFASSAAHRGQSNNNYNTSAAANHSNNLNPDSINRNNNTVVGNKHDETTADTIDNNEQSKEIKLNNISTAVVSSEGSGNSLLLSLHTGRAATKTELIGDKKINNNNNNIDIRHNNSGSIISSSSNGTNVNNYNNCNNNSNNNVGSNYNGSNSNNNDNCSDTSSNIDSNNISNINNKSTVQINESSQINNATNIFSEIKQEVDHVLANQYRHSQTVLPTSSSSSSSNNNSSSSSCNNNYTPKGQITYNVDLNTNNIDAVAQSKHPQLLQRQQQQQAAPSRRRGRPPGTGKMQKILAEQNCEKINCRCSDLQATDDT